MQRANAGCLAAIGNKLNLSREHHEEDDPEAPDVALGPISFTLTHVDGQKTGPSRLVSQSLKWYCIIRPNLKLTAPGTLVDACNHRRKYQKEIEHDFYSRGLLIFYEGHTFCAGKGETEFRCNLAPLDDLRCNVFRRAKHLVQAFRAAVHLHV